MTVGTGAPTLQNIPSPPFVTDPLGFFQLTSKNTKQVKSAAYDAGNPVDLQLLQTGIISAIDVNLSGTVTVDTGGVTTGSLWPYSLLDRFRLSANGQNDLWSLRGFWLHVLETLMHPAMTNTTDVFPGAIGGGAIAAGTYNVDLTYRVPIATDQQTLIGSLFAQSGATNLAVQLQTQPFANLCTANGSRLTGSLTWNITPTWFTIPYADNPNAGQPGEPSRVLVLPDLTRLHGVNESSWSFAGTGEQRVELIRSAGQLHRLLVQIEKAPGSLLSADPGTAAASKIDNIRLEYGGNVRPYDYTPASLLQSINNRYYGDVLPYDVLAFDFVRENPIRDIILLQSVTELAVTPTINSAVTVTAGRVYPLLETLF